MASDWLIANGNVLKRSETTKTVYLNKSRYEHFLVLG